MKKTVQMPVMNAHAAGIDVGSKEHWVAVGQQRQDVRVFGVYHEDFIAMSDWLRNCGIKTIALEATGSYWQTLHNHLEKDGFEVLLCNPKTPKNPKGKSDKKDCCWLQQMHTLGLLMPSFIPEASIEELRQYTRYRNMIVVEMAACVNRMQKYLHLLNVRLDVVLSDITGTSGLRIIRAILAGERDKHVLAGMVESGVKKSKDEIASAINGNWREELLFQLGDQLSIYERYQGSITEIERKIEDVFKRLNKDKSHPEQPALQKRKRTQKGQYKIDVTKLSYQYYGVNLMDIEGVAQNTIMTLISEVGSDIKKFPSAKAFTSWLRLCPNNKISGGKILSSRTPKQRNLLGLALRNCANTIGQRKDGALKSFFSRIAFKKGRAAAITATARKLGVIIWSMINSQQQYAPIQIEIYDQRLKNNIIKNLKRNIKKWNISPEELLISNG